MRRLAICAAVALSGCATGPSKTQQALQLTGARYRECVQTSAQKTLSTTPDRALAVEIAFVACQSEERLVADAASLVDGNPRDVGMFMDKLKFGLKQQIISGERG